MQRAILRGLQDHIFQTYILPTPLLFPTAKKVGVVSFPCGQNSSLQPALLHSPPQPQERSVAGEKWKSVMGEWMWGTVWLRASACGCVWAHIPDRIVRTGGDTFFLRLFFFALSLSLSLSLSLFLSLSLAHIFGIDACFIIWKKMGGERDRERERERESKNSLLSLCISFEKFSLFLVPSLHLSRQKTTVPS